jgi:Domain of unknown function (DUF4150)
MGVTTYAQKRSVVHKDAGGRATGTPDVCLTPPAPSPVPYTNIAYDLHTSRGSRTVLVDGNPIMLKDAEFSQSAGDEAGTQGGVTSGVNLGIARFSSYSFTVSVEGRNVARHLDSMLMNGDPPNATGIYRGTAAAPEPWSLECVLMLLCQIAPSLVDRFNKLKGVITARSLHYANPYFNGESWVTRKVKVAGASDVEQQILVLVEEKSCEDGAVTMKHELTHMDQPPDMPTFESEMEAFKAAEELGIKHGLPTQALDGFSLRKLAPDGGTIVDLEELARMVRFGYGAGPSSATTAAPAAPPEPVCIGYAKETGESILQDPVTKATFKRLPKKGDTYTGDLVWEDRVDLQGEVKCPD